MSVRREWEKLTGMVVVFWEFGMGGCGQSWSWAEEEGAGLGMCVVGLRSRPTNALSRSLNFAGRDGHVDGCRVW